MIRSPIAFLGRFTDKPKQSVISRGLNKVIYEKNIEINLFRIFMS